MKLYTTKEIASLFGVSQSTIYQWRAKGFLVPDITLPSGRKKYSENLLPNFHEQSSQTLNKIKEAKDQALEFIEELKQVETILKKDLS